MRLDPVSLRLFVAVMEENAIARAILEQDPAPGSTLVADWRDGRCVIAVEAPAAA